ncbi:MAG: hypothetical protein IJV17_04645 [Prevotella sp.]|nr:hypothetical protein [Prevotella sp.]
MKNLLLTTVFCACAMTIMAQNIDFDFPGKTNPDKHTETGFTSWAVGRVASDSKTFDNGVTITLTPGGAATSLGSNWSKLDVETNKLKLIGEHVLVTNLNNGNLTTITDQSTSLTLTIEGLTAGEHTLKAYHNNSDKNQVQPDFDISVNGTIVATGQKISSSAQSIKDAGQSFVSFTAIEGQPVVITYTTKLKDGETYTSTRMLICGLEFDVAAITATDPQPANKDFHAGTDDGTVHFSWKAPEGITTHKLILGTNEHEVATSTTYEYEGTLAEYTKTNLYSMQTYYWRVDEVESDGMVHKGNVWSFKPRQLAFPEAEGYGRYAIGGRGGIVYHVTNLSGDPDTPGSFLYGLVNIDEPRYIVFDVSGIIELDIEGIIANNTAGNDPKSFPSRFSKNFAYIAGQTAPGKGICIKSSNIGLGSDVICRHMRFKRGGNGGTGNALGCGNDHTIIDHTTAAWGTDETLSTRGAKNVTFQYSMITEALGITGHKNYSDGSNHGFAATIGGSIGSFSHNLLVNCQGRNWSMGGGLDGAGNAAGELDMFNNVCYNWGGRTTDGGALHMQFVNNYYKMGEASSNKYLFTAQNEDFDHRSQFAYVSGNIRENKNHTLTTDLLNETYRATGPEPELTWYDKPFFESEAKIHDAKDAFKIVTSYAGATMPARDDQHLRNIKETLEGSWTYKGSRSGIKGEIDHEDDAGGWETYPEETRAADFDTDKDGMPDWYEKMRGSDPNTPNQNDDPNGDGWTLLEDYLELMAHPYLIIEPSATKTMDVKPYFIGFYGQNGNSVTPTFSVATESTLFTPSIAGSVITVKAKETGGVGIVNVTVNDGETTWTQRFYVAVTGETTGIPSVWSEENIKVAKREFFTIDGKQVSQLQQHGVYIMKVTDTNGGIHTMKIIKD